MCTCRAWGQGRGVCLWGLAGRLSVWERAWADCWTVLVGWGKGVSRDDACIGVSGRGGCFGGCWGKLMVPWSPFLPSFPSPSQWCVLPQVHDHGHPVPLPAPTSSASSGVGGAPPAVGDKPADRHFAHSAAIGTRRASLGTHGDRGTAPRTARAASGSESSHGGGSWSCVLVVNAGAGVSPWLRSWYVCVGGWCVLGDVVCCVLCVVCWGGKCRPGRDGRHPPLHLGG
jgi:hypothetical protein